MSHRSRDPRRFGLLFLFLLLLLPLGGCGDGDGGMSPTSPGPATLTGTLVRGESVTGGYAPRSQAIGLVGVTVRAAGTSASAVTDGSGTFTLTGLAAGEVELEFERADIHARGRVFVAAGSRTTVTIAIVGDGIVTSPRGHAGEEIEGLVQAIDAGAGTLTVLDQRLGAVQDPDRRRHERSPGRHDDPARRDRGRQPRARQGARAGRRDVSGDPDPPAGRPRRREPLLLGHGPLDRRRRWKLRRLVELGQHHGANELVDPVPPPRRTGQLFGRGRGERRRSPGDSPGRRLGPRSEGNDRILNARRRSTQRRLPARQRAGAGSRLFGILTSTV